MQIVYLFFGLSNDKIGTLSYLMHIFFTESPEFALLHRPATNSAVTNSKIYVESLLGCTFHGCSWTLISSGYELTLFKNENAISWAKRLYLGS